MQRPYGSVGRLNIELSTHIILTRFYVQLTGFDIIGNIWQFAVLDTQKKQIIQDINLYRVPTDLL